MRDELRSASEQLVGPSPSEDAIHEARKSIKKARAVLHLISEHVDVDGTKRLRRAGQLLSPIRDAEATLESVRTLCTKASRTLTAELCSEVGHKLKQQRTRLGRFARRADLIGRAARSIQRVERSAEQWDWKRMSASKLISEVRQSYKQARQGLREARGSRGSEAFHEWRKRIKTLWYALRLLERRFPVDAQLTELNRLEEWLGDDHNLMLLRKQVAANGRPNLAQAGVRRVRQLAIERQFELRKMALSVGTRVFNDKPKEFESRVLGTVVP